MGMTLRLSKQLDEELQLMSDISDMSKQSIIEQAVRIHIDKMLNDPTIQVLIRKQVEQYREMLKPNAPTT